GARLLHLRGRLAAVRGAGRARARRRRQAGLRRRRAGVTAAASETAIAARAAAVREQIARAAARAGRDPSSVRLVAVSKRHGPEVVAAGCRAGLVEVGENYAQEMIGKQDALAGEPACAALRWHFIGRLQRNKARM